ncbi:MAG: glycosyltransferase family 39 protein [Opitutaceae bacterium]
MKALTHIHPRTCALIIVLFACLLYANTFKHGFVFDDSAVLSSNTYVQQGIGGIHEIFTEGSWQGFEPESDMHIYRPFQLLALAVQYEMFGLNPMGYHVVHVLSYALLCLVVYSLLRRMFVQQPEGHALAFLAAIFFVAHPVHTEVVANIKGNGDLLAMLFGILSLHCLHRYSQQEKAGPQVFMLLLGALCFLGALLTKETIVSFVGVGAFLLYFFSELSIKRIVFSLLPMLAMVALYLCLRSWVFGEDPNTLTDTSQYSNVLLLAESPSQELGTRLYALGKNLQLLTLPYPLVSMYVYNSVPIVELWDIRAIFSLVAYVALGIALLYNLKRGSIWGFALAFFFTTLALFANIVFSIPNLVSERWLLIPSLGVCIAAAYAILKLHVFSSKVAIGIVTLILVGYAGYTVERNRAWESNLTLGLTDVKIAPKSIIINRMVARSLFDAAQKDNMNPEYLSGVADAYKRLLVEAQDDASIYLKLARTYEQMGEFRLAAETFGKAASYISDVKAPAQKGYLRNLIKTEQYTRAAEFIRSADLTASRTPEILQDAITVFAASGESKEASAHLQSLLEILETSPDSPDMPAYKRLNNLGLSLEDLGAHSLAAIAFGQAAEMPSPIQGKARFSEAKNLNLAGEYTKAITRWDSLEADYPAVIDVISRKIVALAAAGQSEAALALYERYLSRIEVQSPSKIPTLLNNLGIDLEDSGAHATAAIVFNAATEAAAVDSKIKSRARFAEAKNLNLAQLYEDSLPKWQSLDVDYPKVAAIKIGEAEALEGAGKEAQARQSYKEVLRMIEAQGKHWEEATIRRNAEASLEAIDKASQAFYETQMAEIQDKQAADAGVAIHNDLNRLGITLEKKGAHQLAARTFGELAMLDSPLRGKALFAEANNLNLAGDYTSAAPKWRALDQAYPNLVDVLMGGAEALEAVGDTVTAKAYYQKTLKLITPESMSERYAAFKEKAESKINTLQ